MPIKYIYNDKKGNSKIPIKKVKKKIYREWTKPVVLTNLPKRFVLSCLAQGGDVWCPRTERIVNALNAFSQ